MDESPQPQPRNRSRRAVVSGASVLFVIGSVAVIQLPVDEPLSLIGTALPPASIAPQLAPSTDSESPDSSPTAVTPEAKTQQTQRLIGVWRQEFFGQRTLTVAADGSAKMVIEPAGIWILGFGQRLDLELSWAIKDGRMVYGITSGTPPEKVELAIKSWGDKWDEEIVELTDKTLILLEASGTQSEWERLTDKAE